MSIASEISRLQQAKADLKTSIENKGVTVSSSATLEDYPDYVDAIQQGGGSPNLQSKTKSYTPSETAQSESVTADTGYDGLDTVDISVGAISSTYVGSGITRRDSTDLSASGATVTAPAGYYANAATTTISSGTVVLPSALSSSGNATVTSSGTEITLNKSMSIMANVQTAGYVSSIPSSNADVTLRATDANFLAENIKSGVTLFGKAGSYTGGGTLTVATKTLTNTAVAQTLSFTSLSGKPKYWFLRVTSNVSSSGSTTYYYITDLFYDGTNIKGNTFRIGSTRRVYNITSGITQSYSNGTLTITGGSAAGSQPGQFYGASGISYELVYIY